MVRGSNFRLWLDSEVRATLPVRPLPPHACRRQGRSPGDRCHRSRVARLRLGHRPSRRAEKDRFRTRGRNDHHTPRGGQADTPTARRRPCLEAGPRSGEPSMTLREDNRCHARPKTEAAPRRTRGHAVPTRASESDQPSLRWSRLLSCAPAINTFRHQQYGERSISSGALNSDMRVSDSK